MLQMREKERKKKCLHKIFRYFDSHLNGGQY